MTNCSCWKPYRHLSRESDASAENVASALQSFVVWNTFLPLEWGYLRTTVGAVQGSISGSTVTGLIRSDFSSPSPLSPAEESFDCASDVSPSTDQSVGTVL